VIIDLHCHYALCAAPAKASNRFSFEASEPGDGPTAYDTCLSPRALRRVSTRWLCRLAGWPAPGSKLDPVLHEFLLGHLTAAGAVERHVVLAFDAYHDDAGARPRLPRARRELGSDLYTSNTCVRDLCRRHPRHLLFGASVHPYRAAAVAAVDEVFRGGACLLKLMPVHQNIAPDDPRTMAVLLKCRELGLPLLLHYGPEFALTTQHPDYAELPGLLTVLDGLRRRGALPPVIIAHVGSPATPMGSWRQYRTLCDALRGPFARAPLYADISAVLTWGKAPALLTALARQSDLHAKLLFGTDFPVLPAWPYLRWRFGRDVGQAAWPQASLEVCRRAGFSSIVWERAATLLPNLGAFAA
jgi:predicted TIM-barrel fold metal-dependent hydrolase